MKYLHTMVRIRDIDASLDFYCNKLGLRELRRYENPTGRYTLIFLAADQDTDRDGGQGHHAKEGPPRGSELPYNWEEEDYDEGRNFGHLAYQVPDIYDACQKLLDGGVTINRPPRDGYMAFVRSPDNISIELLQAGQALPPREPWASMPNTGHW